MENRGTILGHVDLPNDDDDFGDPGGSELQSVHNFVVPTSHVQTAPRVQTMPKFNWKMPSKSAPSPAAASAQPIVPVIQMRGVQRTQEHHMHDGQPPNEDDVYHARQQQQNGGE